MSRLSTDFSNEGSSRSESSPTDSSREVIRTTYENANETGVRAVEDYIRYLEELEAANKRIMGNREEGAEDISEARKRQLQQAAKVRHFSELKSLLQL